MSGLIFLLGAGASVDAGMPTVADLTAELRRQLPELRDVNGKRRAGFARLFDRIACLDPAAACNYERFFQWIEFLRKAQAEPFAQIVELKMSSRILDAANHIPSVIGAEISRLLASRKTKPGYLGRLADFVPKHGRLDVFTLNYDCCVEDACRGAKIDITTGFDPESKLWKPSVFRSGRRAMNLHKLHGSLRWFRDLNGTTLRELRPEDRKKLSPRVAVSRLAELILGPGSKIQPDDPYLTLFHRFHVAMRRARTCVAMGYGYGDEHINSVLETGLAAGVKIIDVNIGQPHSNCRRPGNRYVHVQQAAKKALTDSKSLAKHFRK